MWLIVWHPSRVQGEWSTPNRRCGACGPKPPATVCEPFGFSLMSRAARIGTKTYLLSDHKFDLWKRVFNLANLISREFITVKIHTRPSRIS
jgi:hypothetical protein